LKGIRKEHGAASIGALVSPHSTLEELFLASSLMSALGSPNVDYRLRNAEFPAVEGIRHLGRTIASLSTLQSALVVGSNLRKDHPLFAQRIRQAVRAGCVLSAIGSAAQDWAMARTIATGETSTDEMIDIECFDGSRKTILNSATMIVDADGRPSCALVVNQDITALKAVQDDLTQAGRQLAALSSELLAVQERERQALSHELHDEIGQSLTALRITLETARRGAVEPDMTTLAYAISIVDTLLDDVREIARGLRPPQLDELGLLPALRWHVDKIGQTTGLHCALESDIGDRRFLPALELACFRTAQEAITNALRHAQASEINLSLTLGDDGLQLSVRDNGVGFDGADLRHTPLGLLGMRERVAGLCGTLRIDSAPGAGTKIFATFPLEILS
jgi:signal transduction histidine kinase